MPDIPNLLFNNLLKDLKTMIIKIIITEIQWKFGFWNTFVSKNVPQKSWTVSKPISSILQVCEKCGFSTVSKHKLRDHIRAKHEVEKHRKCPYCDYRSEQKQKIHFHIDIKHPESGQKNFFCDKCQMGFIYQQTCTHHMKFKCKHSGKEPFIYYAI